MTWLSVAATAAPAQAQGSADPNPVFRAIFQDDTGVVLWPYGDLGFALHSGDGALKSVSVNIGTWNSLHTGDAGSNGPTGKLWYESDFYAGASRVREASWGSVLATRSRR